MILRRLMLASASAAVMSTPMLASADSNQSFGGVGTSATADLDFKVVIGDFVYFQVGSTGNVAGDDEVEFDLAASSVESGAGGAKLAATAGGTVNVVLRTNVDNVHIRAETPGGSAGNPGNLTDGLNAIPFANIGVTDGGNIAHPAWDDATGTIINPTAGAAIGNITDTWTFDYDNTNAYVPGTYVGTVVYTATTF